MSEYKQLNMAIIHSAVAVQPATLQINGCYHPLALFRDGWSSRIWYLVWHLLFETDAKLGAPIISRCVANKLSWSILWNTNVMQCSKLHTLQSKGLCTRKWLHSSKKRKPCTWRMPCLEQKHNNIDHLHYLGHDSSFQIQIRHLYSAYYKCFL